MHLRRVIYALTTAVLAAGSSGCSTAEETKPGVMQDVSLDGSWRLESAVLNGSPLAAPESARLTLAVTRNGNQALAGCTVLFLDEPRIEGSAVELTEVDRGNMRSCLSGGRDGPFNDRYLDALGAVTEAERVGSGLTLRGSDVVLQYVPLIN